MGIAYNTSVVTGGLDLYFDSLNPKSVPLSGDSEIGLTGDGVAILSMNTVDGVDSSNVRYYNLSSSEISLSLTESVIGSHNTETVGGAVFEIGNITNSSSQIIGEAGKITASTPDENVSTTVPLNNTYNDPIVILNARIDTPTAFVLIVDSVSSNSFDFRIRNWYPPYAFSDEIEVSYVVIEKGVHTLSNGSVCEAFETVLSDSSTQQSLSGSYTATPAVIHQVASLNEPETGEVRINNVTGTGFSAYFQEGNQGSYDEVHVDETVYFMVIDQNDREPPLSFVSLNLITDVPQNIIFIQSSELLVKSLFTNVETSTVNFFPSRESLAFDGVNDIVTSPQFEAHIATEYNHLYCDENNEFSTVVFFKFPSNAPPRGGNNSYALIGCAGGIGYSGTYLFHCNSDNTSYGSTPDHLNVTLRGINSSVSMVPVKDDLWHMGTVTWDGTIARGYFDGAFTQELSVGGANNQNRNANIGANGGGHNFLGEMGPVMFYKKALTESEINQIFNALRGRYGI